MSHRNARKYTEKDMSNGAVEDEETFTACLS